jgi:maltooligosyltrehalose synthase
MHGYDVADPSHLNAELGTDAEFDALVQELQAHGMGLLLDIVPNHMAATSENPWWMDLLEDGPRSAFASHFDVDWHPPAGLSKIAFCFLFSGAPTRKLWKGVNCASPTGKAVSS